MSLATFKKKTTNKYSSATKRSGKPPGGYWLPQGPFGNNILKNTLLKNSLENYGPVGFSINGPYRSISVGKDMKMSKQGTRFRGQYAYGNGGHGGQYYQAIPVMNAGEALVSIEGNQRNYVKPSVVSTSNVIHQKNKGIYTGKYPNMWVQPMYTGNQTETASQGLYVHNKSSANDCWYDVNDTALYENNYKCCQNTSQETIAPYTKTLYQPKDCSDYILRIQRRCQNPKPWQKPFPFAVSNGTGQSAAGTSISSFSNSCNSSNNIYLTPPDWYTQK